jgi:NADH:ubiquinone oxidoreductase subunit F (NADH-binding)
VNSTIEAVDAPLGSTSGPLPRVLAATASHVDVHLTRLGPLPRLGPDLIPLLRESGLLGRGGAAFPTWRKLDAVAGRRRAVVVANGAEGEPASAKDRLLLRTAPHLVLDGLALVADAVDASRVYLYVPAELASAAAAAVRARRSQDRVTPRVVVAPDAFVAGEETAVVSRLSGRAALPTDKFLLPVQAGVDGRPTVVDNVETLAHVALIARYGASWFRQVGTDDDPGTFLATVSGDVDAAGVHELPYGVQLRGVLAAAGGSRSRLQAVLVGGFHGAWLPWPDAAEVPVSRAGLGSFGAAPGAGVVVALPANRCGVEATARLVGYLAGQGAGQCGPCLFGLPRLAAAIRQLASRPSTGSSAAGATEEVRRLVGLVDGRGACRHPDGTARLVRSAVTAFSDDVRAHESGRCLAEGRQR